MLAIPKLEHEAFFKEKKYLRKTNWKPLFKNGMDIKWTSNFYKKGEDNLEFIGKDIATIRTFTQDEIRLFLKLNGFKVLEIINRSTYAFPTFVMIAQK